MTRLLKIFPCGMLATTLAVGFLTTLTGNAALETMTVTGSVLPTDTDYNDSIAIRQFDASLGTLQSVTIMAQGSGQFSQFYQNRSTRSTGTVTISQSLDLILSMPVGGLLELTQTEPHTYARVPVYDGSDYFKGASSGSKDYAVTAENQVTLTDASSLASFTGSGISDFLVSASGSGASSHINGNFLVGWSTIAGLDLAVVFSYIAIPEPSTWMAGVFALASFIFINKHRCKSV